MSASGSVSHQPATPNPGDSPSYLVVRQAVADIPLWFANFSASTPARRAAGGGDPSAAHAIDALAHQITATSGTVTIAGYTDSIGTDADNQRLSQARASAVRQAIAATLGPDFTYKAVGFGETSPVAPNTRQDGSDNPDGRAQNRRVELTVDAAAGDTSQPPPTSEAPNISLDGSPLAPSSPPRCKVSRPSPDSRSPRSRFKTPAPPTMIWATTTTRTASARTVSAPTTVAS